MTSSHRTSRFADLYEILQRHFRSILPDPTRSVFELLIFGCCLEDAPYERAEDSFARLQQDFFDWNEVRVSTVRELSEVFYDLPEPGEAANRVKRVLQSIFEATYSFDLEGLRKQTLTQAEESLRKIDGTTPFTIAYVLQSALGGHVIPLDRSTLQVLQLLELADPEEIKQGVVAGLQRAVPKAKGVEFASLLHQLGAAYKVNPFAPGIRKILLQIDPNCASRLPQRRSVGEVLAAAAAIQAQEDQRTRGRRGRRRGKASAAARTPASKSASDTPAELNPPKKRGRPKRSAQIPPQQSGASGGREHSGAKSASKEELKNGDR
jgi:endonuclease III